MNAPLLLTLIASVLTVPGVALLTWLDSQLTGADVISRLNEVGAQYQSLGSGLFFIIGIFWIGAIDSTRRYLEPASFDPWLRFSAMAFAASYLLSMVFPCDQGCTAGGSLSQWLHVTLVWALYYGPGVLALRCLLSGVTGILRWLSVALCAVLLVLHVDLLLLQQFAGWWQRSYDLLFCLLWWFLVRHLTVPSGK